MQKRHLDKIQHYFMIKTLNKVGKEVKYFNTTKAIHKSPLSITEALMCHVNFETFEVKVWNQEV